MLHCAIPLRLSAIDVISLTFEAGAASTQYNALFAVRIRRFYLSDGVSVYTTPKHTDFGQILTKCSLYKPILACSLRLPTL